MSEKNKQESASIRFQSPAALPVYHRFQALLLRRKAENPGRKVYSYEVLDEALDALERLEQSTVIEYSPDMELSEFVKVCTQAAVNDIQKTEQNETTCPDCGVKCDGYCKDCARWNEDKANTQNETE